jgi:hypothetical protein
MVTNRNPRKPEFNGDVQELLQIEVLRPLRDFPFSLRPLTEHIQVIGHGWYLLTGSRQLDDDVPDNTVRACMILWATNISAAILTSRCGDPTVQDGSGDKELPPVHLFAPTSTGWTYREILKSGRGKIMECAVYGSTGEFVFKELRLKLSKVYFPSRTRKNAELPIAITL